MVAVAPAAKQEHYLLMFAASTDRRINAQLSPNTRTPLPTNPELRDAPNT